MHYAWFWFLCLFLIQVFTAKAQNSLQGVVLDENGLPLPGALLRLLPLDEYQLANEQGLFTFQLPAHLPAGTQLMLVVEYIGKQTHKQYLSLDSIAPALPLRVVLYPEAGNLQTVYVEASKERTFGVRQLNSVESMGIYEGKKTEVVELSDILANVATNNARQIFGRVQGINIWETDMAGLQLGIGTRGLSPKRSANFNTRQNGYDMSADALGYPESYYVPPAEALERIELVKGAASLQYGTQFGGMLNFVLKQGRKDKALHLTTRQTLGSWGFWNSFNSLDGALAEGKVRYYTFYQYRRGDGWRPHAGFDSHTIYSRWDGKVSHRLHVYVEYTHMQYLAQQPGGLMDVAFEHNPAQSFRRRNWFAVNWNLPAMGLDYRLSDRTSFNLRLFGMLSSRQSLGTLLPAHRADDTTQNRTLIRDVYRNWGAEARLLHHYSLGKQTHHLLSGLRYYRGRTRQQQGDADASAKPRFVYLNPNELERMDYTFPSRNLAWFAENIFHLSKRWSITPGVRYEWIDTQGEGYYQVRVFDARGQLVAQQKQEEQLLVQRGFWLGGVALVFRPHEQHEYYTNFSQNYRAITFSDLRIDNPNFRLDSTIRDERGYSFDIGWRGQLAQRLRWDVSLFYMRYNHRIGFVTLLDERIFNEYRFKTNVGDSQHYGIETYAEYDIARLWHDDESFSWRYFLNLTYAEAYYINAANPAWQRVEGKRVEFAPRIIGRLGTFLQWHNWRTSLQYSYVARQFSDADNTEGRVATAIVGPIPAYQVVDLTLGWQKQIWTLEFSINNLLNARYFTNRTTGYPGPGIIPADPRAFFLTVGLQL